jgi:hypothetical protein
MMKLHQLLGVRELDLTHDGLESQLAWVLKLGTFVMDSSSFWRFRGKPIDGHWVVFLFRRKFFRYIKLGGRGLLMVDGNNVRRPVAKKS